jgi:hypothetical protein
VAALLLGGVALVLGLWLLRLFASARVETIRKALVWGGGTLGALLALALLFSGRGLQVLWALALFAPMLWRWWGGTQFSGWFRASGSGGGGGGGGRESTVETGWLTMRLDHASGEMTGRVRQGRFAGRELAELSLSQLLELVAECRAHDGDSVPLLEAWLDRAAPDWRAAEAEQANAAPPPRAKMDRAEALAVLGLQEGATKQEIRAAHRRLMQAAHPDHGGSDWLAARVNQARDVLLRE